MRTTAIITGLALACTATLATAQDQQTAARQAATTNPAPEPSATPVIGQPAARSISEKGVKGGPTPEKPKARPSPKAGVKF